jgi:glycosyltransferase involved in cell wall biosynthesis
MRRCIDSLLSGPGSMEILIVNDGSTDGTGAIAEEYARLHPGTVKAFHQPNKGHGGAINTGLGRAIGEYVKVVDSDDWVDESAFKHLLAALSSFPAGASPDMVVCNYVYEKAGKAHKTVVRYTNALPVGQVFRWEDIRSFYLGQYLLMHAIIYKRDVLLRSGLRLPEHTFYVDNLYAYAPLAEVRTLYYLNADLYRYYIGREGQSVQEKTMIARIGQQLAVNMTMLNTVDLRRVSDAKCRAYMVHYFEIVTTVSSVILLRDGTARSLEQLKTLWDAICQADAALYRKLRRSFLGRLIHLRSAAGRGFALLLYQIARLIVGFS